MAKTWSSIPVDSAFETDPCSSIELATAEQIACEAARVSSCTSAAAYRWVDGRYACVTSAGFATPPQLVVSTMAEPSGIGSIAFVDVFEATSGVAGVALRLGAEPYRGFAVAVPIHASDEQPGLLVVARDEPGLILNTAQRYVLRGHAAHLATFFEVESVRKIAQIFQGSERNGEQLSLLETVAVNARDSILITEAEPLDLPGPRILYSNPSFTRTTGYAAAEVAGQTPRILQGPDTDPAARARLRQAFEAWSPVEVEILNYRKDGTKFWVELSITPVADSRGWFTHWVSVQRDVTERKAAEELAIRVRIAESENKALEGEIQERRRVEAELLHTAFHDSLTQLSNRALFMNRLDTALARTRSKRSGRVAVLFLDLDQFKVVNDSLGHTAGDAMLQEIANRLRSCARPEDTLARIGGDEFALLIENGDDLAVPILIAERIAKALEPPIQLGQQAIFPACSIGIVISSDRTEGPEALIRDADIAMYEAKREGQGGYAIFDASMHTDVVAMLAMRTDLKLAIERDEFELAYQPVVSAATHKVSGFEALVRWRHPTRGLVPPADFIPVAEKMGLIRQIDRWVMREACSQLRAWQDQFGDPDLRMSLNTSVAEFTDASFYTDLIATLEALSLRPDALELEITESIFLHPSPSIGQLIERIRRTGVRIALDDFGTGYSSLSYINRYPIDTLKIDRSFVAGLQDDKRTAAVVELIVKLGGVLGLETIAEGVETKTLSDRLAKMGCSYLQGFYYSKPLNATAVSESFRHGRLASIG